MSIFRKPLPAISARVTRAITPLVKNGELFAVFAIGEFHLKVSPGDQFLCERIKADVGEVVSMRQVLLVGGKTFTAIGRPYLENAVVLCDVEEQKLMQNVPHLHMPYHHRFTVWKDNTPPATVMRVRSIEYNPAVVAELDKYRGTPILDEAHFNENVGPNPVYSHRKPQQDQ